MPISWVIKASKLCNLRCSYCYEWPELSERQRISLPLWRKIIEAALTLYFVAVENGKGTSTYFIWHGGEPLLLQNAYFRSFVALQCAIFGILSTTFKNTIQPNPSS